MGRSKAFRPENVNRSTDFIFAVAGGMVDPATCAHPQVVMDALSKEIEAFGFRITPSYVTSYDRSSQRGYALHRKNRNSHSRVHVNKFWMGDDNLKSICRWILSKMHKRGLIIAPSGFEKLPPSLPRKVTP